MRVLGSSDSTETGMNKVINDSDRPGRSVNWPAEPDIYRQ